MSRLIPRNCTPLPSDTPLSVATFIRDTKDRLEIERLQLAIRNYEAQINSLKPKLELSQKLEQQREKLAGNVEYAETVQIVLAHLSLYHNSVSHLSEKLTSTQKQLEYTQQTLAKLQTESPTPTQTVNDLLAMLITHPAVNASARCKPKLWIIHGRYVLKFRLLPGIKCYADEFRSPNLTFVPKDVPAILGAMDVEVNLNTSEIAITATRNNEAVCATGYNARSPHPHILRHGAPCLGDYAASVSEALDNSDILTFVDILYEFLSRATLSDGAGQYWVYWRRGQQHWFRHNSIDPYEHVVVNPDTGNFKLREGSLFKTYEDEDGRRWFWKFDEDRLPTAPVTFLVHDSDTYTWEPNSRSIKTPGGHRIPLAEFQNRPIPENFIFHEAHNASI